MFQLLPCSVCQRTFSLRNEVPEHSLLKCPNCGNQFRLGEVLDAFYSPWIVLSEEPSHDTSAFALADQAGSGAVSRPVDSKLSFDNLLNTHEDNEPSDLSNNAVTDDVAELATDNAFDDGDLVLSDNHLVVDESEEPSTPLDGKVLDGTVINDQELEEPIAIGSIHVQPPREDRGLSPVFSTNSRSRRRDSGGIWSVLQVVLGGAAAIPVTVLLLWYVVGKDIMNAGPTVAQYAPWIVPKKLRSPAEYIAPRPTGPRAPAPPLGEGGFRDFSKELGQPAEAKDDTGRTEDATAGTPGQGDAPTPDEQPKPITNATEATNGAAAPAEDPTTNADNSALTGAIQAVNNARKLVDQWDPQSPDKSKLGTDLYHELTSLSVQLSQVPQDGGSFRLLKDKLTDVGRLIATNVELRTEFGKSVLKQFSPQFEPENAGRVCVDWVRKIQETDTHWIVDNQTDNYHLIIEVPKQMMPQLAEKQRFFCLANVKTDSESVAEGAPKAIRVSATFFQVL